MGISMSGCDRREGLRQILRKSARNLKKETLTTWNDKMKAFGLFPTNLLNVFAIHHPPYAIVPQTLRPAGPPRGTRTGPPGLRPTVQRTSAHPRPAFDFFLPGTILRLTIDAHRYDIRSYIYWITVVSARPVGF
ncbi:hypothetical protein RB195_017951 [Necator americanus]|uniref:Uncharacterized protein n=1 Tax=Necator americanus TaxID=51031 RepID=A0ABR1C9S5_NECAM